LIVAVYLGNPEDFALELEEIVALNVDGCAVGRYLLDVLRAEPDANVTVVAGAGIQH
jgi:hypothetical protein